MSEITPKLAQAATGFVLDMAKTWISEIRVRKPVSPTKPESSGCTVCMIHQHVVLAHGYIEGLKSRLNPDGTIPAGLGGTIEMAREHVHEAMLEIPEIVGSHPTIDRACSSLTDLLPGIAVSLEDLRTQADWDYVLTQLQIAKDVAYSIPETIYRRDTNLPTETPESQTVVILSQSDKDLLETIRKAKAGEISGPDAKAHIAELLGGQR